MKIVTDLNDTLMHLSGYIVRAAIQAGLKKSSNPLAWDGFRKRIRPAGIDRDMENGRKVTPDQLIAEMHKTVDRLAAGGGGRGGIKILSRAPRGGSRSL